MKKKIKNCIICNSLFEQKVLNQITCSKNCRTQNSKEQAKKYYQKNKERIKNKMREYYKEHYKNNKEKIKANEIKNCAICKILFKTGRVNTICCSNKCKEKHKKIYWKKQKSTLEYKEGRRMYRKSQKNKTRILKTKYNLSFRDYKKMIEKQDNKCSICGKGDSKKDLSIDHNHITGKVRELLCNKCNSILGFSNEDISILQKSIKYLTKWNNKK